MHGFLLLQVSGYLLSSEWQSGVLRENAVRHLSLGLPTQRLRSSKGGGDAVAIIGPWPST